MVGTDVDWVIIESLRRGDLALYGAAGFHFPNAAPIHGG
ncbi:hypothetical protein GGR38_000450 [Novosphingobium sediminicola]|uniref:Uncharacterized protein n=1 Tax=Novosphingobium sediminicola TaxID=563162 RepID=A0A7W6CBI5_9SPHN|nr:hypothetical protein [Novosphingobium sediminicola]